MLLAIPIPALVRCLLKSFTHLLTGLFVILLNCKSSLYILDTSLLLYIWFTNTFSEKQIEWITISEINSTKTDTTKKSNDKD